MKLMFSCKIVYYEESLISAFQEIFPSIKKTLAGGWALRYHSMGIRHFPDISQFSWILSLTVRLQNNRGGGAGGFDR